MNIGETYLKVIRERFYSLKDLGEKTMEQISEDEIHWKGNSETNSVVILVKHLSGNMMSRWTDFLTSDGEKPDRNRDQEFIDDVSSKEELLTIWEEGWQILFKTLHRLTEEDLLQKVFVRGKTLTVIEAIERQLAHYASHVGQIVFIGKLIKGKDWVNLSIPKGMSEEYNKKVLEE